MNEEKPGECFDWMEEEDDRRAVEHPKPPAHWLRLLADDVELRA